MRTEDSQALYFKPRHLLKRIGIIDKSILPPQRSRGWYLCVALIESRPLGLNMELEGRLRTFGPTVYATDWQNHGRSPLQSVKVTMLIQETGYGD
jgi:hypothetical protein